jgi:hypothetical protein
MKELPPKSKPKSRQEILAELRLNPIFRAAFALQALGSGDIDGEIDADALATLVFKLTENAKAVTNGNIDYLEKILYGQIVVLNEISLMLIACFNKQENVQLRSSLMCWALKAQEQSRKTIATLVEIKNPPKRTTFVKHYVDKQLNQLVTDKELEPTKNATLDFGGSTETVGTHQKLETLGEINRPHES